MAFALLAVVALSTLQGCNRGGEGPMERAGKAVDRTGEKVGDVFTDK
jgi:hypothetical protein